MNDLLRRQAALDKTGERFRDKPFVFGQDDCAQLFRFHLKAMGHKKLPSGVYKTPAGAAAMLRRAGVRSLEQLADKLLTRIPPAFMLPGDIALLEAEADAFGIGGGSLVVYLGGKFWGWHPDQEEMAVLMIDQANLTAAWRA